MLAKRHWQTAQEAEMHYISELLGGMEKEGFKFFFPGAPSEWDEDYLNSVIAHRLSVQTLRLTQKWDADKAGGKSKAPLPELSGEAKQVMLDRKRAFHQAMSGKK